MFRKVSLMAAAALAAMVKGVGGFEHQLKTGRYTNRLGNHAGLKGRFERYDGTRGNTTTFKPNGGQERARRMRQIERGQLTASNGLVRGFHFLKVNSHGQVDRGR